MNKLIRAILIVFALGFLLGGAGNVMAKNYSLQDLKKRFPEGRYWNHEGSKTNNPDGTTAKACQHHTISDASACDRSGYNGSCGCNSYLGCIQCYGFALKCGNLATGTNPMNWKTDRNVDTLKAGDHVRVCTGYNNTYDYYYFHSFYVIGVKGSTVTIGECNWGNNQSDRCRIHWGRTITKSQIKSQLYGSSNGRDGYVWHAPSALSTSSCDHNYKITGISKAPTASASGTWTYKCSKCGKTITRTIPALKASDLRNGRYRIVSKLNSNKYISVTPYESKAGGNISLYSKGVADQVFTLEKQSDGTYLIKYGSLILDLSGGSFAGNVQLYTPNGTSSQNWYIVPAGNGWYRITSKRTYFNMDVANAKTENGTNIGTWYNNGNDAQLFKFESVQCTNHKWDSGTITKQPTTAAEGEKIYTCTVCGEKKTEKIPKIHVNDYKLVSRKKATCTEDAVMVFKCSCGKSYTGTGDWEQYSDWSTKKPSGGANITVESRTQYRYADRGMDWQKTGSGTIDFAAGDWKGFDKNNSLYTKYNKTPRLATETPTEKVTVNISKQGYLYFHWCMGAKLEKTYNRTIESYKSGTHKTFHAFYSTADIALTTSANARKSDRYDVCKDTFWWLNERIPISRCSYTTYKKAAVGDWSDWSAWQDTEVKASDTRKVETRTLYRTLTVTPGEATGHNFGPWVKKGNKYQRICKNDPSHIETKNAAQTKPASVEKDKKVKESKKAEKVEKVEADILANTKEEAPEESSSFQLLQLRYKKASKKQIKLKWTSVEGAVQYRLYGAPCGKKYKKIGEFTGTSYKAKKLKKNKYYKFYVIAVSADSKVIAQSKTIHVATAGGKKGNFKAVKLKNVKKTLTLKIGRKFKIKASAVRQRGKKVSVHRKLAYESSDPEVASVSKKGKVKAKKSGSAVIYVYSQSGTFAKFIVKAVK